jgi:hypothetical protein
MPIVVMLSVVMLNVVAPKIGLSGGSRLVEQSAADPEIKGTIQAAARHQGPVL